LVGFKKKKLELIFLLDPASSHILHIDWICQVTFHRRFNQKFIITYGGV